MIDDGGGEGKGERTYPLPPLAQQQLIDNKLRLMLG